MHFNRNLLNTAVWRISLFVSGIIIVGVVVGVVGIVGVVIIVILGDWKAVIVIIVILGDRKAVIVIVVRAVIVGGFLFLLPFLLAGFSVGFSLGVFGFHLGETVACPFFAFFALALEEVHMFLTPCLSCLSPFFAALPAIGAFLALLVCGVLFILLASSSLTFSLFLLFFGLLGSLLISLFFGISGVVGCELVAGLLNAFVALFLETGIPLGTPFVSGISLGFTARPASFALRAVSICNTVWF